MTAFRTATRQMNRRALLLACICLGLLLTFGGRCFGQEPSADRAQYLQYRHAFDGPVFDYMVDPGHWETRQVDPALRDAIIAGTADFVPKPDEKRKYFGTPWLAGWWQRNLTMFRQLHGLAFTHDNEIATHWADPFIERQKKGTMVTLDVNVPEAGDYYVWLLANGGPHGKFLAAGLFGGGGGDPEAWYWMRLMRYAPKTSVALPKGTSKIAIAVEGDGLSRLAALMLVKDGVQVDPTAPHVPSGEGIVAIPMRKGDRRIQLADGAAWSREKDLPPSNAQYARAAIMACLELGKYYLKYPRVAMNDPNGHDYGPDSGFSGLGYMALEEAWMMELFIPVWDHMRFWNEMSDDDYVTIMQTFIMPAATFMYTRPQGLFDNMGIESRSRVSYWAMLLHKEDWLRKLYAGGYGFKSQLQNSFSAEGWSYEGHYQSAAVRPMLFWAQVLVKAGYPAHEIYNDDFKRLFTSFILKAPFWNGEAIVESKLVAERFDEPDLAHFNSSAFLASLTSANMPSLGFSVLRRGIGGKLHAVGMNWAIHEKRGAPDFMGVYIDAPFFHAYQITYDHASVHQSTIVVDGKNQASTYGVRPTNPYAGKLDQFVPDGPAEVISASNDKLYQGVTLYRTAISLESGALVVIDRGASDEEHTYDWPGTGLPKPAGLMFTERKNALGIANGYEGYDTIATVDGAWGVRDGQRALLVLPWPRTLLAQNKASLLVRRDGTTVDAGVAYVPTTNSTAADFQWAMKDRDKVVAVLKADGAVWTITIDYAAKPDERCRVVRTDLD